METITIGFSRPISWKPYAWLIMTAYGTNYDHVYVRMHSNNLNRDIIYQASKSMVNFMGTVVFQSDNIIVKEFQVQITPENKKALMQFAIDNAGKPYSIKEAIGLGLVKIASWFGKTISNPFKEGTSQYVCSIWADYILDNFTEDRTPGDFENASPKDIYDFLETRLAVSPASSITSTDRS